MQNQDLQRQLDALDFIRNSCANEQIDPECRSHWVRYLCVMASVFLENAFDGVYRDYLSRRGQSTASVTRVPNPKTRDIIGRAERFNHIWTADLLEFLSEIGRGVAIDSVMRQRHQIAHQGSSSISMANIEEYLPKCISVMEFIETKLLDASFTAS